MYICNSPVVSNNKHLRENHSEISDYFAATQEECLSFPLEDGILKDAKYVDIINCPICKASDYTSLLVKWGGEYVQCELCSHVYVRNLLKQDILHDLYRNSMTNILERKMEQLPEILRYWEEIYTKYLSIIQPDFSHSATKIMDIGAGSGGLMQFLKEKTSFSRSCTELCTDNKHFLEELISRDGYFYNTPIEDSDCPQNHFDIVTLIGVLEHLHNPQKTLSHISKIIKNEGKVLAVIPNLFSAAFRILGVAVPTINPREHINFYTPKSMQILAKQCGLKVEAYYGELPVIDLMYPYINYSEQLIEDIVRKGETYCHVYIFKKEG